METILYISKDNQYLVAAITGIIVPFTPVLSTGQALSLSKGTVVVRQAHHERHEPNTGNNELEIT